jgi:putative zinc finger protein
MKLETSHDTVMELLPWYVNATLSPAERTVVEKHLETCADCREELQSLSQVSAVISEGVEATPSVDASLARTFAAIDELERAKLSTKKRGLVGWLSALWTPSVPLARVAFATQLALILLMGIYLVLPRDPYSTLSPPGSREVHLDVTFAPTVTEEVMRRVILEVDGKIVSGPSVLGVYVIELSGVKDDDPKVDAVIDKLQKNAEAVRFVARQP